MANAIQPTAKKLLLDGDIDLIADTIKVTLVDLADYTYSAAHDFIDDVPVGARVATATLASKTTTGGVFDAANTVMAAATGDTSEALVIWKDTGNEATSPYVAFFDTGVIGLPITPNGTDITITWNASGILAI
jgi:hypothetical protein